eukprot:6212743-Pleurochrysis_carterae.AAC.6
MAYNLRRGWRCGRRLGLMRGGSEWSGGRVRCKEGVLTAAAQALERHNNGADAAGDETLAERLREGERCFVGPISVDGWATP